MRLNCKKLLLCAMLLLLVCSFAACGKKTAFEKVEVFETEPVSEMHTAAVDAVPVITEPIATETATETTTRRRTNTKRNNTKDETQPADSVANGENSDSGNDTPVESETHPEPETPETPSEPTEDVTDEPDAPTEPK